MRSWTKVLLATLAVVLVSSVAAMAGTITLTLTSFDGTTTITASNSCTNLASCSVSDNTTVGTWTTNLNGGVTVDGGGHITSIDLSTQNMTSSVPASLVVTLTISGVLTPTGVASYSFTSGGNITGSGNSATSTIAQNGTTFDTLGPYSGAGYSASLTGTHDFGNTVPYSMSLATSLTAGTALKVLSTDTTWQVPEPASLALMGVGLFGIGGMFRRKLRK